MDRTEDVVADVMEFIDLLSHRNKCNDTNVVDRFGERQEMSSLWIDNQR